MEFARPWILILLPLCVLPLVWQRRRTALRFSSFRVLPPDRLSRSLELVERALGTVFLAAAVVSMSEPRTAPQSAVRWTKGARLAFVLDQSASMFSPWSGASDQALEKLTVAKEAIRGFVRQRPGDQAALIGFGKSTILYAPPTSDHRRFLQSLWLLQADLGDTVIDAALLRALELLGEHEGGIASQAVILLSDGAGRLLRPEEIAQLFRAAGITLYWLVIEGGRGAEETMEALMNALGSRGKTFVVGEVNELPQALEAVGKLEHRLIKVEGRTDGRSWTGVARMAALGALLALGVFAFGERTVRRSEPSR